LPLILSIISIIYGSCLGLHLEELQHEELQHGVLHLGGTLHCISGHLGKQSYPQHFIYGQAFTAILENKVIRCTVFPAILENKVIRCTVFPAILENKVIHCTVFPAIIENKVISSYFWTYDLYGPVHNAFDAGTL
jgi:hypothetical protein